MEKIFFLLLLDKTDYFVSHCDRCLLLNEGNREIEFLPDGWTVITKDKKLSAQFEHTVAVTKTGVEILTLS